VHAANHQLQLQTHDCLLSTSDWHQSKSRYDQQSVDQSVLVSSPFWGPRPDFFTVRQLQFCWCGAPSVMRKKAGICCSFPPADFSHRPSLHNLSANQIENTTSNSFSVVLCISVAVGVCLPGHCLAVATFSGFTMPPFRYHVAVYYYRQKPFWAMLVCINVL
jgi:hypothetical protein